MQISVVKIPRSPIYDVKMNYSNALYFVFAMYAAKYGSALGHHVPLLTSRKFSLMTSRGNSCSVVTNDDEMMIVRFNSIVPPCCAPHPNLAEGVTYWEKCKMSWKHLHQAPAEDLSRATLF